MGHALVQLLRGDRRFVFRHAVTHAESELMGQPVYEPHTADTPCYVSGWEHVPALDVVVDFSSPEGLADTLTWCEAHGVALVTGTTGLDEALHERVQSASHNIPILQAANFSLGVAVLTRLLREAAAMLPQWDLEILEAHHRRKQDAPSGTALALGAAAAAARDTTLADVAVPAREGHTGERRQGDIGFAVVRGGDIVGEHTAMLVGMGERLELAHRATDRGIFARGALSAAAWLVHQAPQLYGIEQMLEDPVG